MENEINEKKTKNKTRQGTDTGNPVRISVRKVSINGINNYQRNVFGTFEFSA